MKLKKARRFVERFTYKPGSSITIEKRPCLVVRTRRRDSRAGGHPKTRIVTLRALFLDDATRAYLEEQVCDLVVSQEKHEFHEWLRFDGKLLEDPHA